VERRPGEDISHLSAQDHYHCYGAEIMTEAALSTQQGKYGKKSDLGKEYGV